MTYEDSADGPSRQVLVVLNRVDASSIQKKTELTLACFGLDYNLRSQIVKFNRSRADYRIVVKDYSEYATDDDYNAGLTKLNTEIISGNVPDLIANSMLLPIRQYAAKGLLEDLWPYIDADPEYSRDKLMTKPLESLQTDGKLYQLPIDFGVTTAIGLGKVVGRIRHLDAGRCQRRTQQAARGRDRLRQVLHPGRDAAVLRRHER